MGRFPVAVSRPVAPSMRKTTMLSDSWFATNSHDPVGSRAKLRGRFPLVGTNLNQFQCARSESMENTAMLSSPRFDA